MVSEFRAADSQHLVRLREIVSDGFLIKILYRTQQENEMILTIFW